MKRIKLFIGAILIFLTLVSCSSNKTNTTSNTIGTDYQSTTQVPTTVVSTSNDTTAINSTSYPTTVVPTSLPPEVVKTTQTTTTFKTTSQEPIKRLYTIKEIQEAGSNLTDEVIENIEFEATYVKAITEGNDKLMLFVDGEAYINVRVEGGFDNFLKNRYLNCKYHVYGNITKKRGTVEVNYNSLENVTSTPEEVDYTNVTTNLNSIEEVYNQMDEIILNNKKTGVGKIVTFKGCVLSTDRTDSNSKATFYDNNHVITVIDTKKICDAVNDIMNEYTVTGIISILNGQPAILLLDIKDTEETITIDFKNVVEVTPSYFAKWYHVSDKINDPSYADFAKLYKVLGYINIDTGRNGYYFGMTDNESDTLNDVGIKTSVKGVYLMNYQNQDYLNIYNEKIFAAYEEAKKVSVYASLYQFDTQNHAWKMFIVDGSLN